MAGVRVWVGVRVRIFTITSDLLAGTCSPGTALNLREIDALFELKKAKDEGQGSGEGVAVAAEEEEVDNVARAEALLTTLEAQAKVGTLSAEGAEDLESLVLQTRAEKDLFATQVEGLRTRVALQLQARADALAALASSRAFLHRGFRDIEMLLEAGFTQTLP